MRKFLKIGGFIALALMVITIFMYYGIYLDYATGPWAFQYFLNVFLRVAIAIAFAIALFSERKTFIWIVLLISHGYGVISGLNGLFGLSQSAIPFNWSLWFAETLPLVLLITSFICLIFIHDKRAQITVIIAQLIGSSFSVLNFIRIAVMSSFLHNDIWLFFLVSSISTIFSSILFISIILFYYYQPKQPVMTPSQHDISFD